MKNIIMAMSALLLSTIASAQVKFNLSYAEATRVYTVSVIPDVTWESPKNLVSSAQIVLRVDADKDFIPGITSLVNGLTWADNAYIERPAGATDYTFVCISLVNGPTNHINLVAGQETPLFSFVNTGNGCAGKISLVANADPMVQAVRGAGFNVTQHLAVLGARGNAVAGIENSEVDCSLSTGTHESEGKMIDEVKISPVPADKSVTIQWTLLSEQLNLRQMVIYDAQSREIYRGSISAGKGTHTQTVPVEHWQAGMYRVRFVFDNGQQTQSWNLMVIH